MGVAAPRPTRDDLQVPLEYRTRALVLRTFDHGESDRLVHLYTEELGRVSAIAKGARRSRRRFPGTLEMFCVVDVRLVDPPRSSLMRLESAKLAHSFGGLVESLPRYAIACQLVELLDRLAPEREPAPDLLRFGIGVLDVLSESEPDWLLAVLVLSNTLARLGYRPQLQRCAVCGSELPGGGEVGFDPRQGGAVCPNCRTDEMLRATTGLLAALERGIRTPLKERGVLGLREADVRRAELLMRRFFQFHIGFELRTDRFLAQILEDATAVDGGTSPGDTARARTGLASKGGEGSRRSPEWRDPQAQGRS